MPNEQGFVVYRVLLPLLLTQGLHTAPPQKWRCMPITGRSNLADQTNYKELAWWTTQQYSTVSSELRTAAFVCEQRRGPRSRQLWVPGAGPQGRKQNCGQIPFSAPRCVLGVAAQVASWCTGAASGRVSEPVLAGWHQVASGQLPPPQGEQSLEMSPAGDTIPPDSQNESKHCSQLHRCCQMR